MTYICEKLPKLIYGADYNPEQWPESTWDEDVRLMQDSGVNLVSLAIFSWAKLNPAPGVFEFGWLDRVVEKLDAGAIKVNMATATASPPAWLGVKYPEIRPIDANGCPYSHGGRQAYTPNSKVFVEHALALDEAMVNHYAQHPAVVMWHINNEYFCNGPCSYGEVDAEAFRVWLQSKYGSLDALNAAWGTAFWAQIYYDWSEVVPPRKLTTDPNPSMDLDYKRFFSDAYVKFFEAESALIRSLDPVTPLTTNLIPSHPTLDQFKMIEHCDFGATDIYPESDPQQDVLPAFFADWSRSLKPEKPWLLMEQVTSQVQWRQVNPLKRPGIMRLWSMSHIARGSDGIMFFQWRQSYAGSEKFHGAMVPIVGTEQSRVWDEVCELGADLKKLEPVIGSLTQADVGILLSWDCWWAVEGGGKPLRINYCNEQHSINRACWELGITPDYLHPDRDDFSRYPFLIVPLSYILTESQSEKIRRYVEQGGTVLMTYFSGLADANDHLYRDGGFPAMLKDVLGLRIEEWDALPVGRCNSIDFGDGVEVPCDSLFEIGQSLGAETIARFKSDFYAGSPVMTRNSYGSGDAYYIASRPATVEAWTEVLRRAAPASTLETIVDAPQRVEVLVRQHQDGRRFLFLQNYTGEAITVGLNELSGRELLSDEDVSGEIVLPINQSAVIQLA